jgi:hypothetical protein
MSVDFEFITWDYIPEDRTLHGTLTVEAAGSSETVGNFLPEHISEDNEVKRCRCVYVENVIHNLLITVTVVVQRLCAHCIYVSMLWFVDTEKSEWDRVFL